ncbi:MAG: pilus assembly protein [Pseudomonadota bacterium]
MNWIVALLLAVAVALAPWFLIRPLRRVSQAWMAYQQRQAVERFADAFIFLSTSRLHQLAVLACLVLLATGLALGVPPAVAMVLGLPGLAAPAWFAGYWRRKRQRRLLEQLPDALSLLAGLLRAGQGLVPALAQLARRQQGPLGQEWQLLLRKHRLGIPLDVALSEWHRRVPEPEVALVALTVRVSRELGGNLAEALQRLADAHRARLVMRGKIEALTSQGRLQGVIVGLMPIGLLLVLLWMDPSAMRLLFTTTAGWLALVLIMVLETCGFLLIRRIVRIDV